MFSILLARLLKLLSEKNSVSVKCSVSVKYSVSVYRVARSKTDPTEQNRSPSFTQLSKMVVLCP